jgi:hypothetical protein
VLAKAGAPGKVAATAIAGRRHGCQRQWVTPQPASVCAGSAAGMLGRLQPAVSGLWPLVGVARAGQELAAGDRYQRPGRDRADQQADGREDRH